MNKITSHLLVLGTGMALGALMLNLIMPADSGEFESNGVTFTDSIADISRHIITPEKAARIVNRYQHDKPLFPLKSAVAHEKLKGFYIERHILDTLLQQDGCTGVRIYLARSDSAPKRRYTTLLVASRLRMGKVQNNLVSQDSIYGVFLDYVDPCPSNCAINEFQP